MILIYLEEKMQHLTVKEAIEILLKCPQDAYIRYVSDIKLESRHEVIFDCHDLCNAAYDRGYSHGKSDAYESMYRP